MSWTEQHLRTEILHTVLARAAHDPARADLFDDIPHLDRLFGGPQGVIAALRYRWNIHLDAKLEQGSAQGRTPAEAYRELAAEQPVLRAVLDTRAASRMHRPKSQGRSGPPLFEVGTRGGTPLADEQQRIAAR